METNTNKNVAAANEIEKPSQKKVYNAPQFRHFGSMTDIVQFAPNRGVDGSTSWADCTFC